MEPGDLVQFKTYKNRALGILLKKSKSYRRFLFDEWEVLVQDGEVAIFSEEIDFYLLCAVKR